MPRKIKVTVPVKKSVTMQIDELSAQVTALTTAIKQLISVKDGRHESVLVKLKDISDKLGV